MNSLAISKINWIIDSMLKVAKMKKAAVFNAEKRTRGSPFKILVFTMLSARTRDQTTMDAVDRLFKVAKTPKQIADLKKERLEQILYGIGFYRTKTKNLQNLCKKLILDFNGKVPEKLDKILTLPGVGRKTANIVLARAFGKNTLGVDVHVNRISTRLGVVKGGKPEQTELTLQKIFPKNILPKINLAFVAFGQTICLPKNPKCNECVLFSICPQIGV